ncbi:MAG TPA: flippase activity-associated protein Agl23, partial [Vicinamibacteria bacterium]
MSAEARRGVRPETWAWLGVLALNVLLHFAGLGERAMSHDESLHAFYSWRLSEEGIYEHDPMMHGPFLFHTTAVAYRLLGASDATARVLPALAGVALVLSLLAFRRYLGRAGALAAALLVTFSPSLLFYGRCLIHDVYAALFALLWTLGAFRFCDTGRLRWLLGMTVAMALSFSVKATAFLFGPVVGLYFAGRALAERRRGSGSKAARCAALAVTMVTLALPLASSLAYLPLGWDSADLQSPEGLRHAAVAAIGLFLMSVLSAWVAFRRPSLRAALSFRGWIRVAAPFWAILVLLFSTMLTHPRGLATGIVGSLGYWLGQHPVARGGQPWFFYLALGALYEFLPALTGAAGALALARLGRGGLRPGAGR